MHTRRFNEDASANMLIFIRGGTGVYYVTLQYSDRKITERLIKIR